MDMALLKRELQGTYDGVFLVKPSDGKPLEQYRIVFGVTDGKRCIDKVEKDGDFDAAVYALELEKGQITGWAETVLKGSRANVLSHLPKGEYPYLNAPLLGITGIDVAPCKSSTQPATAAAVSCWKGEIIFSFKPEKSKFDISERLEVEIEKKGNLISVVKCERDEKFAQLMKEKVQVAEFIANYISQPNQRSKWLAKGGDDCLPASMTSMTDRGHTLALGLVDKTRFYGARFANGKSGKVKVFQGVCEVKEGLAASRYCFLVVCTDDKDTPFLMGYAVPDKPQR